MSGHLFPNEVIRASAGSGKTHRLTNRYVGLLVSGAGADLILATTFTRKAAGEILDRVLARVAKAAGHPAEARILAREIGTPGATQQDFVALLRNILSNLHRARIGTLDSFYIALADSFGLELGLPAGWSICEESDDLALRKEAVERLLESEEGVLVALYQRLCRGQTKRAVEKQLMDVVSYLYRIHKETEAAAWGKVTVDAGLVPAKLDDLVKRIEVFDLSGQATVQKARDEDLQRIRGQRWKDLLGAGLGKKVFAGENTYSNRPIPDELMGLYRDLLPHIKRVLIEPVAEQTKATREFLDRFGDELWKLKQATGALRFDEVTQSLVDALRKAELAAGALAFRLDGAIEHLLLDEFQDTSLPQWRVLDPIARRITERVVQPPRSFFCVGDVKQAIFGWRGGRAEIFNGLEASLGHLIDSTLLESRRSAQPVIDVVNGVFGGLDKFRAPEKCQAGVAAWGQRFEQHTTAKKEIPGYVCLRAGPGQQEDEVIIEQRGRHYQYVAQEICDLSRLTPQSSIGVLCRKNDAVARLIYELRKLNVDASEEGGNPLTDSAAVELILSLFLLTDHPGHSVAWFHLQNSPLEELVKQFTDAPALARHLRRDLMSKGYGAFTYDWAKCLSPACNRRDLSRLQQLVEMAYGFQSRSTLRADDFVAWVRGQYVPDPSAAKVRVMTIHGAKGLEFDAVILPELDVSLSGMSPFFVTRRRPNSLDADFVCRYVDETLQSLLSEDEQVAFEQDRRERVEESLSLLYVAMTRAIYALYLYIPGLREKGDRKDGWHHLLLQTLVTDEAWASDKLLYEHGDASWFQNISALSLPGPGTAAERPKEILFRTAENDRPRGLQHVAPSQREGQARVRLDRLFDRTGASSAAAGILCHAWFADIGWLEDGIPSEDVLRACAEKKRVDFPAEIWRDLDLFLADFRAWLQNPRIRDLLYRSAYAGPQQPGFPTALAPFWTKSLTVQSVERERRFLVRDGANFWNGSLDRVIWIGDGDRIVAADVIDFKTDAIPPDDEAALATKVDYYRPQMEAYRVAVARLGQLPADRISTRLVFTSVGQVVDI